MDANPPADPFAITTHEALAALYAPPSETVPNKATDRLEAKSRAFIRSAPRDVWKRPEEPPSTGQPLAQQLRGQFDAAPYDRDGPARLLAALC